MKPRDDNGGIARRFWSARRMAEADVVTDETSLAWCTIPSTEGVLVPGYNRRHGSERIVGVADGPQVQ
jgi:hypothetical protein